jgi:hypothetical protein
MSSPVIFRHASEILSSCQQEEIGEDGVAYFQVLVIANIWPRAYQLGSEAFLAPTRNAIDWRIHSTRGSGRAKRRARRTSRGEACGSSLTVLKLIVMVMPVAMSSPFDSLGCSRTRSVKNRFAPPSRKPANQGIRYATGRTNPTRGALTAVLCLYSHFEDRRFSPLASPLGFFLIRDGV